MYSKTKRQEKIKIILADLISEYGSTTTIHGIPYFSDNKRSWVERIFWAIGFMISVSVCMYLISKTWIKWKENPVIVSFAQEHTPVWNIPFPAVTICPLNKIIKNKLNYSDLFAFYQNHKVPDYISPEEKYNWTHPLNDDRIKLFWQMSLICNLDTNYNAPTKDFEDESITSTLISFSPQMNQTIRNIQWQNKKHIGDLQAIFSNHLTSEGLCFTFNSLGYNDMYSKEVYKQKILIQHDKKISGWSIENGYSDTNYSNSYPERTQQAGLMFGLNAELTIDPSQREGYCGESVAGYKVLLHNPAEIPRLTEQYFLAPSKQQVTVAVTPNVIRTSKQLKKISPHVRNCYFENEKNLRYFRFYTQYNCKIECEANITLAHCNCLPFYMPKNGETKICAIIKQDCLSEVKNQIFLFENMVKNQDIKIYGIEKNELDIFKMCNCLPSCNTLEYEAELSQAEYLYSKSRLSSESGGTSNNLEITSINIFFKESQFLTLERNELYGQTDFVANIGGLLGLFMGFSFLSLLEIIYFLTLRFLSKYYNYRNAQIQPVHLKSNNLVQ